MQVFCSNWSRTWLLGLTLSLSGCIITSRHEGIQTLYLLPPQAQVLVTDVDFPPHMSSAYFYTPVQREFAAREVAVAYAPAEEWKLRAQGIQNPRDTQQFVALQQLGYTHLLIVRRAGQQPGSADYFMPWEVALSRLPQSAHIQSAMANAGSKSRVSFTLISLVDKAPVYFGMTTTSIGSLAIHDQAGGVNQTNLTVNELAIFVALKKGTRQLLSRGRRVPQ
jgi:hypothetical protein